MSTERSCQSPKGTKKKRSKSVDSWSWLPRSQSERNGSLFDSGHFKSTSKRPIPAIFGTPKRCQIWSFYHTWRRKTWLLKQVSQTWPFQVHFEAFESQQFLGVQSDAKFGASTISPKKPIFRTMIATLISERNADFFFSKVTNWRYQCMNDTLKWALLLVCWFSEPNWWSCRSTIPAANTDLARPSKNASK